MKIATTLTTGPCPVQAGRTYRVQVSITDTAHVPMTLMVWQVEPALTPWPHGSANGPREDRWQVVGTLAPDGDPYDPHGSWVTLRGYYTKTSGIRPHHHDGEPPARCSIPYYAITILDDQGPYVVPPKTCLTLETALDSTLRSLAGWSDLGRWDPDASAASLRPVVEQVRELRGRLTEAEAIRDDAIRALAARGDVPVTAIARVAGVNRRRIYQICDDSGDPSA